MTVENKFHRQIDLGENKTAYLRRSPGEDWHISLVEGPGAIVPNSAGSGLVFVQGEIKNGWPNKRFETLEQAVEFLHQVV